MANVITSTDMDNLVEETTVEDTEKTQFITEKMKSTKAVLVEELYTLTKQLEELKAATKPAPKEVDRTTLLNYLAKRLGVTPNDSATWQNVKLVPVVKQDKKVIEVSFETSFYSEHNGDCQSFLAAMKNRANEVGMKAYRSLGCLKIHLN